MSISPSHPTLFDAVCCCRCYQRSVAGHLCPGQREGDWAARCCRSPWQSPGTPSRSMACAYWLNGTQRRGETEEALGQMEQLEGTNVSIFKHSILGEDVVRVCMSGKIRNVCVNTKTQFNHIRTLKDSPRFSSFLHTDLVLRVTLHTAVVGSVIKASQISPYHTHRELYCSYQSATMTRQRRCTITHEKNSGVKIKCLRFAMNLTFNCELIIHPCAECSVPNDQRPT